VSGLDGVLVVDKPKGPTSHDVVDRVRHELGARKAGHTGTLDPLATGVLAVCLGKATRLARFLAEGEKVYRATLRFGFATSTDDALGEPMAPPVAVSLTDAQIRAACAGFVGSQLQVPPAFSAKRVAGRRAYAVARGGGAPEVEAAPVTIHALDPLWLAEDRLEIEVRCSPGTYVRALARDLGRTLGCGAHLAELRRTRSGPFRLDQSVNWDEIRAGAARMLPLGELLPELPAVRVGGPGSEATRHGRDLPRDLVLEGFPADPPPQRLRVLDERGRLLALAVPRGFAFRVEGLVVQPVLHPEVVLGAA
jgi:tRNA pseudouridine55 synthase